MIRKLLILTATLSVAGCGPNSDQPSSQQVGDTPSNQAKPKPTHVKTVSLGEIVPDFEVSYQGKSATLNQLRANRELTRDGTLVLTFWCTTCDSCRVVEAEMDALAKEFRGQVGVCALAANYDETEQGVADFAKSKGLALPILLNPTGHTADIFGVKKTTTTVVIDKDARLRYIGRFRDDDHTYAANALREVLAKKPVQVKKTRQRG